MKGTNLNIERIDTTIVVMKDYLHLINTWWIKGITISFVIIRLTFSLQDIYVFNTTSILINNVQIVKLRVLKKN